MRAAFLLQKINCPNIDKIVPMIYKYSIEGKEEGSGGYEKKECY